MREGVQLWWVLSGTAMRHPDSQQVNQEWWGTVLLVAASGFCQAGWNQLLPLHLLALPFPPRMVQAQEHLLSGVLWKVEHYLQMQHQTLWWHPAYHLIQTANVEGSMVGKYWSANRQCQNVRQRQNVFTSLR
jgi:hypothetical protein